MMRYTPTGFRPDLVICNDCSTRTLVFTIPADEQADHDAWHDSEPSLV